MRLHATPTACACAAVAIALTACSGGNAGPHPAPPSSSNAAPMSQSPQFPPDVRINPQDDFNLNGMVELVVDAKGAPEHGTGPGQVTLNGTRMQWARGASLDYIFIPRWDIRDSIRIDGGTQCQINIGHDHTTGEGPIYTHHYFLGPVECDLNPGQYPPDYGDL